ncbi:hypothetical protein [Devosia sp. 2618]|uniref:hypothetical protein n=1 Tax=Devosia sp. 2618 TaxID=3156454 RepID=UPI003394A2F4
MLGADGIFVELAGEAYELRPSLRATMRLLRRHQLFGLIAAVEGFNITIIMDMLREAGIKPALLLAEIATVGLGKVRNRLTGPLAEFALAIAGIDPDDTTPIKPVAGKPITPTEYHTQLFEIATGWLGWTAAEAWNATPAEIIAAQNGHVAYLKMTGVLVPVEGAKEPDIYTAEQLKEIEEGGLDPAFDRDGLAALKAKL